MQARESSNKSVLWCEIGLASIISVFIAILHSFPTYYNVNGLEFICIALAIKCI